MSAQPSEIEGSIDTLKQILVNLIKNAVEAVPKGGHIEIINNGRVQRDGREYLVLCVKDNGPGLPAEVLANLFSPVKSAKAGENHGLGLSIVNLLVKKLNGVISCSSTKAGASFEIHLPARTAAVQRAMLARITDLV
jgi:signal transduction histidine kinase